ncbi:MAG: alpha/beta hydrolase [Thermodesulfobacteriota bacterium]
MKEFIVTLLLTGLLAGTAAAQESQPAKPLSKSPPGVQVYRDLAYVPDAREQRRLNLYVPENRQGPLPLIVWIHGGGWKDGSRNHCPILPWTQKGYAVASLGYRLSQRAKFPAQIEDCKAAIRWLRVRAQEYNIDPNRMAAWGESAGGHLASLLGTAGDVAEWEKGNEVGSSRVQLVIDWYGRANLIRVATDPALADSPSALLLGGNGDKVAELARRASPITYVSADDPPFLIMHGDLDKVVPLAQSEAFAQALREAGVEVNLVVLKGAGHGGEEFLRPEYVKIIDTFLNKHLGPRRTAESK